MPIDRHTLLFFDAACLMAAARSPAGGSGFLLGLCARGYLQGVVSQPVLLEAERNIRDKMRPEDLTAYHQLLTAVPLVLAPLPSGRAMQRLTPAINAKDAHVVAAALKADAPYLITLDRGLVAEVNGADLPLQAWTPGDFIVTLFPQHPDYLLPGN